VKVFSHHVHNVFLFLLDSKAASGYFNTGVN